MHVYIFWPALIVACVFDKNFSITRLESSLSHWSTLILWLQYAYMTAVEACNFKLILIITTFPDLQVSTWIVNHPLDGKWLCTVCLAANVTCSQIFKSYSKHGLNTNYEPLEEAIHEQAKPI